MFIGIDFGTSNSSAAIYTGNEVEYIPLDARNPDDVHVLSSLLYLSSVGDRYFGHQAIQAYIDRMAGHTIKLERKDIGDVEMNFADLTYVAKGYYLEEKDIPGRLFQYLKKYAGAAFHTNVFGTLYKPYELIALLLNYIKTTAEEHLRHAIDGVVLGRPVRFTEDVEKNRDAARNMHAAASLAGFKQIEFQYEPVAAAFNYALSAKHGENILIFDFGGGTFDVTIVRMEGTKPDILGLAGVPVGGSDFDKSIMYEKIAPYFGRGYRVDGQLLAPDTTYLDLLSWQTIMNLNRDRRFLRNLDRWIFYADDPTPFKALQRLVKENHGFAIFQEIENAKKQLSFAPETTVFYWVPELFHAEGEIAIEETISRQAFQAMLVNYSEKVFHSIDDALNMANLPYHDIHRVIRVGGSSKIPFFHDLLAQKFGPEKLFMKDEFKNVAAGLALEAFRQA